MVANDPGARQPGRIGDAAPSDDALATLSDHMLVLGTGELTDPIIEEFEAAGVDAVVVVTLDESAAEALRARGVVVLVADPSDVAPLDRAGIDRARAVVVATSDDAADALAVLTARQRNPDVTIVAAVTNRENADKLALAGASTVISPALIGGRMLVRSALGGADAEALAERILEDAPG